MDRGKRMKCLLTYAILLHQEKINESNKIQKKTLNPSMDEMVHYLHKLCTCFFFVQAFMRINQTNDSLR